LFLQNFAYLTKLLYYNKMQNIYMNYPFIDKSIYSLMYFSMHCRFGTFGLICEQPVQHSAINYVGVVLAMIRYFMSGERAPRPILLACEQAFIRVGACSQVMEVLRTVSFLNYTCKTPRFVPECCFKYLLSGCVRTASQLVGRLATVC
jgi:hypothetical protein